MKLKFFLLIILSLIFCTSCTLKEACLKTFHISNQLSLKKKTIALLPGTDHVNDHYLIDEFYENLSKEKLFTVVNQKTIKKTIQDYIYINPSEDIKKLQRKNKKNPNLKSLPYLNNKITCDYYIIMWTENHNIEEIQSGDDTKTFYQVRIHTMIIKKDGLKIIGGSNCLYRQKHSIVGFFDNENGQLRLIMKNAVKKIIKDIKEY